MKKKKLFIPLLCIAVIIAIGSNSKGATSDTTADTQQKISEKHTLDDFSLDELQKLYLAINPNMSYSDTIEAIQDSNLPYSEEKYNGSRELQVAFTEGCTAQKYMDESGDYLQISFDYPSDENSANDDLSKYMLSSCVYCPEVGPTLLSLSCGYYFSYHEPGNYIDDHKNKDDTSDLPSSITKEDQLLYYFEHRN